MSLTAAEKYSAVAATAHTRCNVPIFAQSRALQAIVAPQWRDALFDMLESRPADAIYSIAFSLSFTPTFNLRARDAARSEVANAAAASRASRELFDLLDDLICGFARSDSRIDLATQFVAANEEYVARAKEHERFVERYYRGEGEQSGPEVSATDRERLLRFFEELNASGAPIPFVLNVNGSRTTGRFDTEAIGLMSDLHAPLPVDTVRGDDRAGNTGRGTIAAWSPVQLYIRYAYARYRFASLRNIARSIELSRGVEILPLIMPTGCAWQAGTSQLLWILLHTICALSISRVHLQSAPAVGQYQFLCVVRRMQVPLAARRWRRFFQRLRQTRA